MKALNRQILLNSIKIIVAAIVSISLAMLAKREYEVTAGIVTILTIQPTKKETIQTAISRFVAFTIAMVVAYICFKLLGFTMYAFFLFLTVYILICQALHWYGAITMNAVLVSHFLTHNSWDAPFIFNEVSIFFIGVGVGIFANLHLRKNISYIEEMKIKTDEQIQKILVRMSERILNHDMSDYNGECFFKLRNQIREAKNEVERNYNNQLGYGDIYDLEYIYMRDEQYQVLYEMYNSIRLMDMSPVITEKISCFLKEMAEVYRQVEKAGVLMEKFYELDKEMKAAPLPTERKDFENRAYLFSLMRHIEELLKIKLDFAKKHFKDLE